MKFFDRARNLLNDNPFKKNFKKNRMRPPGAVDEEEFMERCIRCGRCIAVCPYDSIVRADSADGLQVGTPYVYADRRACVMCMLCPEVCPTGALDTKVKEIEQTRIGIAVIDQATCLNYIYARDEARGYTDGTALFCNTCFNVCPLRNDAIYLEDFIIPVITDKCTGCGMCVERCPNTPERSIEILPTGMGDAERAGLYHLRTRHEARRKGSEDVLGGSDLLKEKGQMTSGDDVFEFEYNFNTDNTLEGW